MSTLLRWTQDDERYLTEHYFVTPIVDIAGALGRTEEAVARKARHMGMMIAADPTPAYRFELHEQPDSWPMSVATGLGIISRRLLKTTQKRLGSLVEYGDIFNTGYLFLCQAPYYNMLSLEQRLYRLFSDGGMKGTLGWQSSPTRTELGCSWGGQSEDHQ